MWADWDADGERPYFYTDDMVGCDADDETQPGTCIMVYTGSNKIQGRIKGRVWATEFLTMKVSHVKDVKSPGKMAIDIRGVDKDKIRN